MSQHQTRYGFSQEGGVDWTRYLQYRPIYPPSFYEKVFEYHNRKPQACWLTAHDVGAGAGIVSGALSGRFQHVVVSDPNEEYLSLARDLLTPKHDQSNDNAFTFWQKPAEDCREVRPGTVDLITACECIQYTDTVASLNEFHRQLKVGGSLLVSYYARPVLPEIAPKAWDQLFEALVGRLGNDHRSNRAVSIVNSGLASLEFPEEQWEDVKRVYINSHGSRDLFKLTNLVGEDKTKSGEEIEWLSDEAWVDYQGVDWLKAYVATWAPTIAEEDALDIWDDISGAVGEGKTRLETPVAIILATKKGVGQI